MSTCSTRRRFQGFTVRNVSQVAQSSCISAQGAQLPQVNRVKRGGSVDRCPLFFLSFLLDPSVVLLSLCWHSTEYLALYLFSLFSTTFTFNTHKPKRFLRHSGGVQGFPDQQPLSQIFLFKRLVSLD